MCGIVGIITKKQVPICSSLVQKLKLLEYRGYDSSGLAFLNKKNIKVCKSKGEIKNLEQKISAKDMGNIGIAHTRWATHGKPSVLNAHPFLSDDKNWAIVHNGIVENYLELKSSLANVNFCSQTDSEVIAKLLQTNTPHILALIDVCNKIKGSFAIVAINKLDNNTLFVAKRKSPIYVMQSSDEVIVASDTICFENTGKDYYTLLDDEFCEVSLDKIIFYDKTGKVIKKSKTLLKKSQNKFSKDNLPHFMLKEILEEKFAIKNIIDYCQNNGLKKINKSLVRKIKQIIFIGCGSAYHAGLIGAKLIERYAKIPSTCHIASEFSYAETDIKPGTVFVFISQSGETADTLANLELAKGFITIGVTNNMHSTLSRAVSICLDVMAGKEIAVASTKAYLAQVLMLYVLSRHLQNLKFNTKVDYLSHVLDLLNVFEDIDFKKLDDIAKFVANKSEVIFIGRDLDYYLALEASLKLKEVSYIPSFAVPSGELKHGYLAQVDNRTCVVGITTQKNLHSKTLSNVSEAHSRGGNIVVCSPFDIEQKYLKIDIPNIDNDLICLLVAQRLQYLAYRVSVIKGFNPDKPRNLAKSVTVE